MKTNKKIAISCVCVICMIFFLLSGCKKDEEKPFVNNMMVTDVVKYSGIEDELRTFYYFEAGFYESPFTGELVYTPFPIMFCAWPKGNCLPDVPIYEGDKKSNDLNNVKEFEEAYKNGNLKQYFCEGKYLNLIPKIDELYNVKDRIINGDILFHYLYSSEDSTKYYIGLPKEIEIVPDNTEWVGQVECAIRIKTIKK